jgi:hypothetical protein
MCRDFILRIKREELVIKTIKMVIGVKELNLKHRINPMQNGKYFKRKCFALIPILTTIYRGEF